LVIFRFSKSLEPVEETKRSSEHFARCERGTPQNNHDRGMVFLFGRNRLDMRWAPLLIPTMEDGYTRTVVQQTTLVYSPSP